MIFCFSEKYFQMYLNTLLQYLYFVFTSIAGDYFVTYLYLITLKPLYLYLNTFGEYFAEVCNVQINQQLI